MFVSVAKVSEFKVKPIKMVSIQNKSVAVVSVGEKLFAIEELCPHRAGPLSEGKLEGTILTCPWHRAQFEVTSGRCLGGPASRDLKTYLVRVVGEDVQVDDSDV